MHKEQLRGKVLGRLCLHLLVVFGFVRRLLLLVPLQRQVPNAEKPPATPTKPGPSMMNFYFEKSVKKKKNPKKKKDIDLHKKLVHQNTNKQAAIKCSSFGPNTHWTSPSPSAKLTLETTHVTSLESNCLLGPSVSAKAERQKSRKAERWR